MHTSVAILAQEPKRCPIPPSLLACTMATGAAPEKEDSLEKEVNGPARPWPCGRRAGRRLAGRFGLLGRLFAEGKVKPSEVKEKLGEYIQIAEQSYDHGREQLGGQAAVWSCARRRAAAQEDSIFFHLRHSAMLGKPVPKARLATFLAASGGHIGPVERRLATAAHSRAVEGRHIFTEADVAGGACTAAAAELGPRQVVWADLAATDSDEDLGTGEYEVQLYSAAVAAGAVAHGSVASRQPARCSSHRVAQWPGGRRRGTHRKEDQNGIYHITGESNTTVSFSPFLEALNRKSPESMYMEATVDEPAVQQLEEFDGMMLSPTTKEGLDIEDMHDKMLLGERYAGLAPLPDSIHRMVRLGLINGCDMEEGQNGIYYITGDSNTAVSYYPFMGARPGKGLEVQHRTGTVFDPAVQQLKDPPARC